MSHSLLLLPIFIIMIFYLFYLTKPRTKHTKSTKTIKKTIVTEKKPFPQIASFSQLETIDNPTSSYFFHYFGATSACPTTIFSVIAEKLAWLTNRVVVVVMPIITITIIASKIENEEERVIALGGDTSFEIRSVNSLDKSIYVARLSRIISHATDRQLSGSHASHSNSGSGEARMILFRGGGGGRSGLCILRD